MFGSRRRRILAPSGRWIWPSSASRPITPKELFAPRLSCGKQHTLWSIQNGLGNLEAMARVIPSSRIVGGSTTMGQTCWFGASPSRREGDTFIGELDGSLSPRVELIAKAVSAAGIRVQTRPDIQRLIWGKVLVNVAINALTAILRVRNGVLLEHEPAVRVMEEAVREAYGRPRPGAFASQRTRLWPRQRK